MSEEEAREAFKQIRWAEADGDPVCPRCGSVACYTYKTRQLFKCKGCDHQYSVTSGTIFASRKLPVSTYLLAIAIFVNEAKGNDRYGHAAGDEALKCVAHCLGEQAEIVARLGGEEFVLLLPGSDIEQARGVAEDTRSAIAACEIDIDGTPLRVTCSFGVAVAEPGATIDDLLRRSDAALYAAKRDGRNRVAVHDPGTPLPAIIPASVVRRGGDRSESARRQAVG